MINRLNIQVLIGVTALVCSGAVLASQEPMTSSQHKVFTPQKIQWADGPDSLPKGAKISVLEGDLSKKGAFTARLKFPANYVIPPHWHPITERVTVLSGDLYLGMGEKLDKSKAERLPTDSFAYMQPKMRHFAFTKGETVIQLHGTGPWAIHYINPKDDPRNKEKKQQGN